MEKRPIRPSKEWRTGVYLGKQPASTELVHLKKSDEEVRELVEKLKDVKPENR